MSSKDNLLHGSYTSDAVKMARKAGNEFVIGFIAMSRVEEKVISSPQTDSELEKSGNNDKEDWIVMTPGVQLSAGGDKMGQQYRTPRDVVLDSGCDVIIVGRGIYGIKDRQQMVSEAERYRDEGWQAYEERLKL